MSRTTLVRRAVRKLDGVPVILKGPSREYPTAREIGQLEFEYRVLRKLEGPGIVRALDLERAGTCPILVLEDYGGENIDLRGGALLPLDVFFNVAVAVARTLGHVHARDVIHKDVTLSNTLMHPRTHEVKLIDFGIASELSREHQSADTASQLEGTLPFISPEQTGRMNRDLDYRTDYYSFGVSLFQLLTGSLPFSATDVMGWVHCHISRPAPNARDINPRVPDSLARVVRKLMAKNPADRYQSAHGIIRDLECCRDEGQGLRSAAPFTPGLFDVSERFQLSQTLFGRVEEARALRAAFEQSSVGRAKLLLVAGYSGVGKSALIHELQRDVVARQGHFVEGKFDQLERNIPYGALAQAVRALVKQLLREPEAQLRQWLGRVSLALGPNARLLIDLIPELASALGPQPPVPALSPREAQARFQRVFAEFIKAAAPPEHPLVIFIDDLQWADPSTPEFLVYLLSDQRLEHVLIIGAYRDNEVREGHLLLSALEHIRAQVADAVVQISLEPLTEASVNQIVAETMHCDPALSAPLATLISQKTGGNPFFVKELLNLLARAGAFRFVASDGRWVWDDDKILAAAVSDNVADLLVQRLQQLPEITRESLRLAACIGNRFDLQVLARLAGKPAGRLAAELWRAVEERVLTPVGSGYRLIQAADDDASGPSGISVVYQFQHDRVQQAAYSLLSPDERASAHLRMGRLLLAAQDDAAKEAIFDLVNHLNLGRSLMLTFAERSELLGLNEMAGAGAKRATAFGMATAYFETGLKLLSAEEWAAQAKRQFECRRASIECIYYSGDPEGARLRCDELIATAPDRRCRIAALELRARILDHQARLPEAIATLRTALGLLGLDLPEDRAELNRQIGEGIGKMQAHLARVPVEELVNLPEMVDEEKLLINSLLFQLVVPAVQADPPLFVLVELLMFDLASSYGTTPESCKNFVDCGMIQGPMLGDYDRAYRLGKVAFEFLGRDSSKPFASGVSFVFATFVSHWRAHYQESFDVYVDAERWGQELGDIAHATYASAICSQRWFFVGRQLDACLSRAESSMRYLKQMRADNQLNGVVFVQRAAARLRGSAGDQELLRAEPESAYTARLRASANNQWLFLHGHAQVLVALVLGDFAAAEEWNAFTAEYLVGSNIHFSFVDQHLLDTLICGRRCGLVAEPERSALLERMEANVAKLQVWASHCPGNFGHKHKFASAEVARARRAALQDVITLYGEAIASAGDEFVHLRALANERLADYWQEAGQAKIARLFLEEAHSLYEAWGAGEKLRQLARVHPALFDGSKRNERTGASPRHTHVTEAVYASTLDLESMIKATRTISGEVKRDKVFAKLMATIIENAGAQRGCLILESETPGQLRVAASTRTDESSLESPLIEQSKELCARIVRYVARTLDTVVVDDATEDSRYRDDAYISANAIRSVLCMPVSTQGKLVAILYAENNAATHAFTAGRLRLLEVIAAQAAISITNAQLYDNLEQKVLERTRELATKNAEVGAMLNSMQQGVFTIDDTLQIDPRYSPHLEQILGTGDIAGKDCVELLFRGSAMGHDVLETMRMALGAGFMVPVAIASLNWGHLVKAFERQGIHGQTQCLEIDWNPILGEDEAVAKMLIVVRDVTALKQLHAAAAKNARELDIVGQILDAGPAAFHRFFESSQASMRDILSSIRSDGRPARELTESAFRSMHTVKGNARLLGLTQLVDVVHGAEEVIFALRARGEPAADGQALAASAERVLSALAEYEEVSRRKLGEVGRQPEARSADTLELIAGIVRDAGRGSLRSDEALASIDSALKRATTVSLRELVSESARMLPSLARELGKAVPSVECSGAGLALKPSWARLMRDVLIHTLRNSLDHGIESTEEREATGKTSPGRIVVAATRTEGRISVVVRDDGRGLQLAALRHSTGDLAGSDEDIAERVFLPGVSTARQVSQVSGRGVGMDAVRTLLRRHGGEARIAFTAAARDGCRPFELELQLPEDAALVEQRPVSMSGRLATVD